MLYTLYGLTTSRFLPFWFADWNDSCTNRVFEKAVGGSWCWRVMLNKSVRESVGESEGKSKQESEQ